MCICKGEGIHENVAVAELRVTFQLDMKIVLLHHGVLDCYQHQKFTHSSTESTAADRTPNLDGTSSASIAQTGFFAATRNGCASVL